MSASDRYPTLPSAQASTPANLPRLVRAWDCFLRLLLVLWIVRAPLATTLLGLALLRLTPQTQDLFMEFARTGRLQMLEFLLALVFIWAVPTHYAARLLVDTDRRFCLSLVRTPDENERCSQVSALWTPRVLGLLTFVAVLIAIWRSSINVPELNDPANTAAVYQALVEVAVLVVVGALLFFGYMIRRPRRVEIPILRLLKPVNRILAPLWRRISPGLEADRGSDDEIDRDVGRLLLLALFVGFVLAFIAGAENVARVFSRSMAVPFILGGWLPFLGYLSGVGRACRAPLILLFFASVAGATFLFGDNHEVRLVSPEKQAGYPVDTKTLSLENAVSLWKEVNCPGNTPCPAQLSSPQQAEPAEPHFSREPWWVICSTASKLSIGVRLGPPIGIQKGPL